MKKVFLFLLLLGFVSYSSCKKEEVKGDSTLHLNFDFNYGSEEFIINHVYDYPLDYSLKIEKLLLYIAEVKLIDSDGKSHDVSSIIYVDSDASDNGITVIIPEGNYKSMTFSLGVPQSMNGTDNPDFDAALYDPNHPLSLSNGMYWTWNSGYRFVLMDGRINTTPQADDEFETLLSIHTGKDYSYRTRTLNLNYNAVKDNAASIVMQFDVAEFLAGENDVIDIAIDNQSHGTNENLANRLSDNAIKAVSIQ
jgi:hypothetical protein